MEDDRTAAVGRRVAYWRDKRGLSRDEFGDLVGRSASWVQKIELGQRNLDKLPMLKTVARALRINHLMLMEAPIDYAGDRPAVRAEVWAIRESLADYSRVAPDGDDARGVTVGQVQQQLRHVGEAWLASHFSVVARQLPSLLKIAPAVAAQAPDAERQGAHRAVVMAYKLACSILLKYRESDVAWLAADRAMRAAETSDDDVALGRATRSVARALGQCGQHAQSVDVAVAMAARLRPLFAVEPDEAIPMYGMLLLAAEISAALNQDPSLANELHFAAMETAMHLVPRQRRHDTQFGVANVGIHRVASLTRLHEGGKALQHAETINTAELALLPAERRATYRLDLAEAHFQTGSPAQAIFALQEAAQIASQEVRRRPAARDLIVALLSTTTGGRSADLGALAVSAGVPI